MNLKLKDIIQELKKYSIELDTNIKSVKKLDNEILFETDSTINEVEDYKIKRLKGINEK